MTSDCRECIVLAELRRVARERDRAWAQLEALHAWPATGEPMVSATSDRTATGQPDGEAAATLRLAGAPVCGRHDER